MTGDNLMDRFQELLTDGKRVAATSPMIDIHKCPSYFDQLRFKRAQLVCQKHFINISLASSAGLTILVQIESILLPLLKTKRSRTVVDLYDRYSATGRYILSLYESDFIDPESEGWRHINIVRAMHQRVHKLMMEDQAVKQMGSNVWVNQYDMALTQFAFVGLFLLRPDMCAAYRVTKEELMDVVYYWRLISYYFGIEDRFNLFVYHEHFDKQLDYLAIVFKHIVELLNGPRNEVGLRMAKGISLAFEEFSTESSFNILDHWWSPYLSLSGQKELSPYTLAERLKLVLFLLYSRVFFRLPPLSALMNRLYKRKFLKFCASGDEIKLKLGKKYKDLVFE